MLCRYISYYDCFPPPVDYISGLHRFRDIYRRYFLRNIPIISLADYKEKIEIYTKYLEKKSNWNYTGGFRKLEVSISQGDSHSAKMEFELQSGTRVLAGGDYYQKVLFCRPNNNGFKHLWVVIIFI